MTGNERLNAVARRQIEKIGRASGARYVAERMEILNGAKKWLEENEVEDPDVMDILAVAEFLAGDRTD